MICWRPHTIKPCGPEVALIAAFGADDNRPFLLPEIYRWHPDEQCWRGVANCLMIKHHAFQWAPEAEVLETLE